VWAGSLVTVANQSNRRVESDVEKSYGRLESWANWLGLSFREGDTPYERADRLSHLVPERRTPIRNLTHQYVLRRFSRRREGDAEFDPKQEWSALRPLLLRQSILRKLRRFREIEIRLPGGRKVGHWD